MKMLDSYFYDFKFGDKYLSDFGGVVYNTDGWKTVNDIKLNHYSEELPKRDGEYLMYSKLSSRIITIPIAIKGNIDIDEFFAWLISKEAKWLEINGRRIKAILDNTISLENYFIDATYGGVCELSFICFDPYFRDIYDECITITSNSTSIFINGNVDSYPLIKIVPIENQSKIRFEINSTIYTLNNVNRTIYIDCETEEIYEIEANQKISVFEKYTSTDYYDFPFLKPFLNNTFNIVEGEVSEIKITLNNRYI